MENIDIPNDPELAASIEEAMNEGRMVKMIDRETILYCDSCQRDIKVVRRNKPQRVCPHIILKE